MPGTALLDRLMCLCILLALISGSNLPSEPIFDVLPDTSLPDRFVLGGSLNRHITHYQRKFKSDQLPFGK